MADEKNLNDEGKPMDGNQPGNDGAENPPAKTDEIRWYNHPFQAWGNFKKDFTAKYPVASRRIRKAVDMAEGGVLAVGALILYGASQAGKNGENSAEDFSEFLDVTDNTTISDVPPSNNQ